MIPMPISVIKEAENSSDGNQIKFLQNGRWYKVDSDGNEGLAESLTTMLLQSSNVESFAIYKEEKFFHNGRIKLGCSSENFLPDGCSLVTAARLFKQAYGKSPSEICSEGSLSDRMMQFVSKLSFLTKLSEETIGSYLTQMFEVDSIILNKDRHFNNIAFIRYQDTFMPAPLFDHGDSFLLTDYTTKDLPDKIESSIAKPFLVSHKEQVSIMESAFGRQFSLTRQFIPDKNKLSFYDEDIIQDALIVLNYQLNHLDQNLLYINQNLNYDMI